MFAERKGFSFFEPVIARLPLMQCARFYSWQEQIVGQVSMKCDGDFQQKSSVAIDLAITVFDITWSIANHTQQQGVQDKLSRWHAWLLQVYLQMSPQQAAKVLTLTYKMVLDLKAFPVKYKSLLDGLVLSLLQMTCKIRCILFEGSQSTMLHPNTDSIETFSVVIIRSPNPQSYLWDIAYLSKLLTRRALVEAKFDDSVLPHVLTMVESLLSLRFTAVLNIHKSSNSWMRDNLSLNMQLAEDDFQIGGESDLVQPQAVMIDDLSSFWMDPCATADHFIDRVHFDDVQNIADCLQ